ncbi:NAD(P)-dependent oxidoreductase [Spiractinospora alimapuensis]|uniref:NAD(P)-dependent oxidoreductase n=1 Tax=Spiractinospora alimapuensis TaxID=2820884 RepID=UPI001F207C4E|nr:NAD(P)-binding domain-containing protein [Spiractinospora alimapuensis]QVQ50032.1 NAD(P)-dependent oxidoreductase [Spiractinospora alimapuensis]
MPTTERTPVTVLGLGNMGAKLAHTLLKAGYPVTVWNRSPDKAGPLVAAGAHQATTVEEAVTASPLLITCLLDHDSVHHVLDPVAGHLRGRTLVELTTSAPEGARELSTWAEGHGVAGFLDGGIMATPDMIPGPHAFILYSGSERSYRAYESTLAAIATPHFIGADPGIAALYDLALLNGMYGMFGGLLQALALVDSEGVDLEEFASELLLPWMRGVIASFPESARQAAHGDYGGTGSTLAMQASASGMAGVAEDLGVNGELMRPIDELMRRRVADGHGDDDFMSVFELVRHPDRRIAG